VGRKVKRYILRTAKRDIAIGEVKGVEWRGGSLGWRGGESSNGVGVVGSLWGDDFTREESADGIG
jgi:hypothetical protein